MNIDKKMAVTAKNRSGIEEGKKYRLEVRSAGEAVRIIRERMGERARVLSVKQVERGGISRLFSAPRLEIVATIPPLENDFKNPAGESRRTPESGRVTVPRYPTSPQPGESVRGLMALGKVDEISWNLLRRGGFNDTLVNRFRQSAASNGIEDMPRSEVFGATARWLLSEFRNLEQRPIGERIAFLGGPGVGKSTALCKRLTEDVFRNERKVDVLKLENDCPNPDDTLSVLCEILGVPLFRNAVDESRSESRDRLYVDLPGLNSRNENEVDRFRSRLDELEVDSRVLVVHAGFESALIDDLFRLGEGLGATHLVLTHFDEISNAAKLWSYILFGGLTPWFLGLGQSTSDESSEEILSLLMSRTFPPTCLPQF